MAMRGSPSIEKEDDGLETESDTGGVGSTMVNGSAIASINIGDSMVALRAIAKHGGNCAAGGVDIGGSKEGSTDGLTLLKEALEI